MPFGNAEIRILKGMQSYEADRDSQANPKGMEYLRAVIKPLLFNAVENNIWLDKGWVDIHYNRRMIRVLPMMALVQAWRY